MQLTVLISLAFACLAAAKQGSPVPLDTKALPQSDPRLDKSKAKPAKCYNTAMTIPECGHGCMEYAQMSVGCDPLDFTCGCTGNNPAYLRDNAIGCVLKNCTIPEAIKVQENAESICTCAGLKAPSFSITSAAPVDNSTSSS